MVVFHYGLRSDYYAMQLQYNCLLLLVRDVHYRKAEPYK